MQAYHAPAAAARRHAVRILLALPLRRGALYAETDRPPPRPAATAVAAACYCHPRHRVLRLRWRICGTIQLHFARVGCPGCSSGAGPCALPLLRGCSSLCIVRAVALAPCALPAPYVAWMLMGCQHPARGVSHHQVAAAPQAAVQHVTLHAHSTGHLHGRAFAPAGSDAWPRPYAGFDHNVLLWPSGHPIPC